MSKKVKEQTPSNESTPKKQSKKSLWLGLGIGAAGASVLAVVIACILVVTILVGILICGAVYVFMSRSESTNPGFDTNTNSGVNITIRPDGSMDVIIPGITETFPTEEPAEEREVGCDIGNLCPSDELRVITSDGITYETIDPTNTGKVTIINFWGTWCSACVAELPYFDQIATEFEGQVEVFAVHTSSVLVTAPNYIANNYPKSNITFLADHGDGGSLDAFYTALGGAESGGCYPYTVILDENGVIVFKSFGSMHYKTLLEQIKALL